MKKILLVLLTLMICGCDESSNETKVIGTYSGFGKIIIVDGCQYAVNGNVYGNVYTHVGSCTNCWTKMERLIGKKLNAEREEK